MDVTPPSLTRLSSKFMDLGLLTESSRPGGARGQPKKMLSIESSRFFAIGVHVSLGRVDAVLVDLSGKVRASNDWDLTHATPVALAGKVQQASRNLMEKARIPRSKLLGAGFALPGNFGTNLLQFEAHQAFGNLIGTETFEVLREALDCPVFFENDGSAAVLGEYLFGPYQWTEPIFLVHLGVGLGGGAVLDGKLFRGHKGNACLPGALFPYGQPRPTWLDLKECLDRASIDIRFLNEPGAREMTARPVLQEWVSRSAEQLQLAVRVISGFFDPKIIVLGGPMPTIVTEALARSLNATSIPGPSRGLAVAPVTAAGLGMRGGAIGAASLPIFECLIS